ncbi:MAG: hypothetical protein LBD53_02955 [Tannerella sp.]|jgi:hypothetical protein|nr:hypothetical protein [Tannerella sp.]
MKKHVLLLILVVIVGCDSSWRNMVSVNEPVIMSETDFRNSVKVTTDGQNIKTCGKICLYNGYLFVSEPSIGIHIIDNRTPANPKNIGFIEIPGNADVAVHNDLLYADALIDLVWFDISNPAQPVLKGRLENVFPDVFPIAENNYACDYSQLYDNNGQRKDVIVTGWEVKKRYVAENDPLYNYYHAEIMNDAAQKGGASPASSVNGSMSRFAFNDKYLYAVIKSQMQIFDVSGDKPTIAATVENGMFWEVETMFGYKDKMFLGMPSGMTIYDVKDPLKPEYCSMITHIYGCDPVVVDNDLAYVTIRSGNFCGQQANELFIVDVKDVYNPKQIVSYTMKNPKGLGIDSEKKTLFLCDDGLKVFKITDDPQQLISNGLEHIKGMDGFDLIAYDDVLMMIADDGLYQYDYSDVNKLKQLSKIKIYGTD